MKKSTLLKTAFVFAMLLLASYYAAKSTRGNYLNNSVATAFDAEVTQLKSEMREFRAMRSELNTLHQELAKLKLDKKETIFNTQQQQGKTTTAESQQDEKQVSTFNPVEIAKKQEEQHAKELESINNAFVAEAADPNWSAETTVLVTSFFESEAAANIDLADVQCRKTLCKVEINEQQGNAGSNAEMMLNFPVHVSKSLSQASFFQSQNDDGTTRMTMFLVRNGYDLPET